MNLTPVKLWMQSRKWLKVNIMSATCTWVTFVCLATTMVVSSLIYPDTLSDKNTFLKNFVNHEMLSFVGVCISITLAYIMQIHVGLNQLESVERPNLFPRSREILRKSVIVLISIFSFTFAVCVLKAIFLESLVGQIFFNICSILLVFVLIVTLLDISMTYLRIPPS